MCSLRKRGTQAIAWMGRRWRETWDVGHGLEKVAAQVNPERETGVLEPLDEASTRRTVYEVQSNMQKPGQVL